MEKKNWTLLYANWLCDADFVAAVQDNLFECCLGMYLELEHFLSTGRIPEKRDTNCWRRKKKSCTKNEKKEVEKKISQSEREKLTGRAHRFVLSKTKSGDDALLFDREKKGADMQMNELKKKSRAFQVLLNAYIAWQTRKKMYTNTHTEKERVFKQFTLCMQTMRIFMILENKKKRRRTIGESWGEQERKKEIKKLN